MSLALAVLGGALVVALLLLAVRAHGRRQSRRPAAAALPEGWLDLGALPVPHARRRPLPRMLSAYLDPSATDFANAVRHVRTRLVLDAVPDGRGVVLVDAGACATDAPWVTSNLALGLAQLGPVLLVHGGGGMALDAPAGGEAGETGEAGAEGDAVQSGARQGAGNVRAWRAGMIDLMCCEPGTSLAPDIRRWRDQYEWIVVDGACAAWTSCSEAWPPEGLVCISLYAGADQLSALVTGVVPHPGAGAVTRAVLGVVER